MSDPKLGTAMSVLLDCNQHLDDAAKAIGTKQPDGSLHLYGGVVAMVGALPTGMQSSRPSVMIEVVTEDGRHVFAQTTMRLFLMAASAFAAKWPGLLADPTVFAADVHTGKAVVHVVPDGHVGVIGSVPAEDAVTQRKPDEEN